MNTIRMVVFDMAGTVIDEDNTVYKTIQKAIMNYGLEVSLENVLLYGAGKEKRLAITDILSQLDNSSYEPEAIETIFSDFRIRLDAAYEENDLRTFSGVKPLMKKLRSKGITVVWNTGYSRAIARKILKKVDIEIGKDIDELITSDDVTKGRPAPDMILKACTKFGIKASETVKIGDSVIDIIEGKNAHVLLSIGVTTGAQTRSQLSKGCPDHIFDDINQILDLL